MKEVEILFSLKDNKKTVLKKLEQFNFVGIKKTLDIYFHDPKKPELSPDKNNRLNSCLRLRKKDNKFYLTYKTDHFDDDIWSHSDEYEVKISDFETGMEILENLGFKILTQIDNEKHTFLTDKYEIVFEDVKNLGLFLEVERLSISENENIAEAKQEIRDFVKYLSIKIKKELNAGKPELMLKKQKNPE